MKKIGHILTVVLFASALSVSAIYAQDNSSEDISTKTEKCIKGKKCCSKDKAMATANTKKSCKKSKASCSGKTSCNKFGKKVSN